MAITKLKKFKINTHPSNEISNTLAVGDIVHRQYFDGKDVIYSLMYVHEVGTDTVESDGADKRSHYFIGSLLYGDEPKNNEVLEFVRITSLTNPNRAGAIYLTASDNDSPYMDVLDGLTGDKAVFYPSKIGTNGYEPINTGIQLKYNYKKEDRFRVVRITNDGSGAKTGIKHSSKITNTGVWLVSMFVSASKEANVNVKISNKVDIDANYTEKIGNEPVHIFLPVTTTQIGMLGRNIEIYSDELNMSGDWLEVSDLVVIQLSDVVESYSQINARIGKLDGIHDKIYGHLSGYGAYLKDLWATRNANVAGTITAGDKDGFGASFYAGKIHKNILINSLGVNFLNAPTPALVKEISPFGIGNVYKSTSTPVKILAQSKEWVEKNINKQVCFSIFVKAQGDVESTFTINTYNGNKYTENIHPNSGWMRINTSLFLDKVDGLYFEISGDGLFTAPQLEFGDKPTLYQPTDSKLNYTDEYGAWFNRGGIGGTIQNPLLKLNEDGSIESQGDGFKINKDGSGHLAGGALTFDDKRVNISFTDSNIGKEVDGVVSKLDKKIDDEVGKLETNFEIKEGQIATSVKEVRDKTQQIVDLGEEIKVVGDNASQDALSAKNSAEQANKSYNLAKGEASKASSEALDAKNKADIASQKAIEAENKAKEALESAGKSSQSYLDAKKEAELAGLEASNANKDALLAKEKAELAQSKASLAEQEANRAKSEADRASSAKDSVVEMDTSIKQTAEKITSTATQVEKKAGEATEASLKAESEAAKASKNAADANSKALEAAKKAEEALASAGASSQSYLDAKAEADKALKEAGIAADKAKEANQSAIDAQNSLTNVTKKETAINQTAEKIESTATIVTGDALKAKQAADLATSKATEATANAQTAKDKATEAQLKAEEALKSAGESSQAYKNAKLEADKAVSEAVKAANKATEANKSAVDAQNALNNAKTIETKVTQTANEVNLNAKKAVESADRAVKAEADINLKADGIVLEASEKSAQKAIDGLEIGVRNFVLDSQKEVNVDNNTDYLITSYRLSPEIMLQDGSYTLTFNITVFENKNAKIWINGNSIGDGFGATTDFSTGKTERITRSFRFNIRNITNHTPLRFYNWGYDSSIEERLRNKFVIHSIKLEKGNKSTDWTPAPEDYEAQITETNAKLEVLSDKIESNVTEISKQGSLISQNTTKISQNSKEIASKASKAEVDNLTGRVTKAESSIKQSADKIESNVKAVVKAQSDADTAKGLAQSAQDSIDGLEIGGRNLMALKFQNTSSSYFKEPYYFVVNHNGIRQVSMLWSRDDVPIKEGDVFTLSYMLRTKPSKNNTNECAIRVVENDGVTKEYLYPKSREWINGWVKQTHIIKASNKSKHLWSMSIYNYRWTKGDDGEYLFNPEVEYRDFKLERGTKPTDWTPAPEDYEAQITKLESSLTQTNNEIKGLVKKTDYDANNKVVNSKISEISQKSDKISLQVTEQDKKLAGVDGRVKKAEIALQPDNIWLTVKDNTKKEIDSIEVGGRNLISDSLNPIYHNNGAAQQVVATVIENGRRFTLNKGTQANLYTNYFIKNKEGYRYVIGVTITTYMTSLTLFNGWVREDNGGVKIPQNTTVRVIFKGVFPSNNARVLGFYATFDSKNIGDYFDLTFLKVEFGNKPTDWTPAPEDYSTTEEIKTSLKMTDKGISMIGTEIDMTGGITFSMMKDGAGNTLIQGGKVKTDKLNVVDIVAKGIRTNHIEGLTLNFTKGKIGGWGITSSAITKNNVSLTADGSIQNGAKWLLKNDGSGMLASNNIKWDVAGNVTFSGNVKVGLGNLNSTIIANNKIKTSILNANEIVTNGLTADHITGKTLNFKQGTIGGWEILPTYLRSDKITLDPTGGIKNTSGMWEFNPDGTAKIGKNGVVELMSDERAIVGGFAFVNSSLISRKGNDSNGYVSNKWQSYPNGGFSPYIMLNGITGEAFFKKSRIERSDMVDCFIEGAFLERMNNVYGYPSLLVPSDELLKDSTIDVSNGFNVNLFTREKYGGPLSNFFLLPDSLKNKYVGCTIRIQKYSEEADYRQDYDGWTNGNNLKPSNIPATIKMNQHDIEGVVNRISVPDRGYIELTSVKRSDIDIVYPDGHTLPFEEQESVVVWRLSHISNEAKSYFGRAYIRHGEILDPVNMPLEKKQDYYIIPANILSSFGANVIEFNNFDDAVKYKIFGESGGSDMFYLHISGKRIDVYNGGNGYRRLNQWNGAIAFQTKGGEDGFLVTRNIY